MEDGGWSTPPEVGWSGIAASTMPTHDVMRLCARNVMTNNVAFGTAEPTKAPPPRPAAPAAEPAAPAAPVDPDFEAARRAREASPRRVLAL